MLIGKNKKYFIAELFISIQKYTTRFSIMWITEQKCSIWPLICINLYLQVYIWLHTIRFIQVQCLCMCVSMTRGWHSLYTHPSCPVAISPVGMTTVGELRCLTWPTQSPARVGMVLGNLRQRTWWAYCLSDMPVLFLHLSPGKSIYSWLFHWQHLMPFMSESICLTARAEMIK